jgi:hypothetical protein
MEALEVLIGEWELEASFQFPVPDGVSARTTFEWALDKTFILQRATISLPEAPDGLMVIAKDGDGYTQHYFDSRGVVRLYAMQLTNRVWTLERTKADFSELPFQQRFIGTISDDGNTIDGRWESSDDGSAWELDFGLIYRRA